MCKWRRERVWQPTLFCGCRSFCKEILNLWTCDRARTFVRPVYAADIGTAGRYGDARTGSKSPTASSKLRESSWFFLPGSFRSFAHAFRYFLTTLCSFFFFQSGHHIYRWFPIILSLCNHGPNPAGHFVCECYGHKHGGLFLQHPCNPRSLMLPKTLARYDYRHRS